MEISYLKSYLKIFNFNKIIKTKKILLKHPASHFISSPNILLFLLYLFEELSFFLRLSYSPEHSTLCSRDFVPLDFGGEALFILIIEFFD